MERSTPFSPGTAVVWRSRPEGEVGYVFGCRVLVDDPQVVVGVQPTGAPVARRVAQRGGPNGRSVIPATWDGRRQTTTWEGPPSVRLHPVGRAYAVIRSWVAAESRYAGWYINLEQPWVRTTIGFDSRDDVLDVVVSDDLSECHLKDEEELEFAIEVGVLTTAEGAAIRSTAAQAVDDATQGRWPFDDAVWTKLPRPLNARLPTLPDGWDQP